MISPHAIFSPPHLPLLVSGMFVQPLVGRLSDARSTSSGGWAALTKRFGRRRPFLAVGGLVLVLAQLLVGQMGSCEKQM